MFTTNDIIDSMKYTWMVPSYTTVTMSNFSGNLPNFLVKLFSLGPVSSLHWGAECG